MGSECGASVESFVRVSLLYVFYCRFLPIFLLALASSLSLFRFSSISF